MKRYLILLFCFAFLSCKTYTISTDSFKEQFTTINKESLVMKGVEMTRFSFLGEFLSNDLKTILVKNKEGKQIEILNKPSLEMRITTQDNKRRIVYFDTAFLQNDTLYGLPSRLIKMKYTQIPFKQIIKIEVQNGGKKYNYRK